MPGGLKKVGGPSTLVPATLRLSLTQQAHIFFSSSVAKFSRSASTREKTLAFRGSATGNTRPGLPATSPTKDSCPARAVMPTLGHHFAAFGRDPTSSTDGLPSAEGHHGLVAKVAVTATNSWLALS